MQNQTIMIGADHAGFALKEDLKTDLQERGFDCIDAGVFTADPADYPDIGGPVAAAVSQGRMDRAILICGSGIGMSIVANRYPHVRAALCYDEDAARVSREHNDANILVLAGRRTPTDRARAILAAWLSTPFVGDRHKRRLAKIEAREKALCR